MSHFACERIIIIVTIIIVLNITTIFTINITCCCYLMYKFLKLQFNSFTCFFVTVNVFSEPNIVITQLVLKISLMLFRL